MARVELAPALLFAARRLLLAMCGWLAARRAGVTAFALRWRHDTMRPRSAGEGGELIVRTATPTRTIEHLARLLAEHLDRLCPPASVGELGLVAVEVHPLAEASAPLLPDPGASAESLGQFRVEASSATKDDAPFMLVVLACDLVGYDNPCGFVTGLRRTDRPGGPRRLRRARRA